MSVSQFLNTVILLGALQGLIICVLLVASKKNRKANKMLSALIFFISLASLGIFLMEIGLPGWSQGFFIFSQVAPFFIIMPVGPLVFFYTRRFSNAEATPGKTERLHFLPVLLDLVPNLVAVAYIAGSAASVLPSDFDPWLVFIDEYNTYVDIPRWLSVTLYLFLSLRFLIGREKMMAANAEGSRWLKQFIFIFLCFQVIWLIHLVPYIIPQYRYDLMHQVGWYPVYIPLAALIYWLGIKGYLISQTERKSNFIHSLSPGLIASTQASLQEAMEDHKLYLDPSLNLSVVANHLKVPQKVISAVLNQYLQKSFNEFVNEYRIREFKKRIVENGNRHVTIAGVALESGFNSQATFQRTFKQVTGMSPKQYLSGQSVIEIST